MPLDGTKLAGNPRRDELPGAGRFRRLSIADLTAFADVPELLIPPARHARQGEPRKDGKPWSRWRWLVELVCRSGRGSGDA